MIMYREKPYFTRNPVTLYYLQATSAIFIFVIVTMVTNNCDAKLKESADNEVLMIMRNEVCILPNKSWRRYMEKRNELLAVIQLRYCITYSIP